MLAAMQPPKKSFKILHNFKVLSQELCLKLYKLIIDIKKCTYATLKRIFVKDCKFSQIFISEIIDCTTSLIMRSQDNICWHIRMY